MSATSHDALSKRTDPPPQIGVSAPEIQDPTEDIAEEITSELGAPAAAAAAQPAGAGLADAVRSEPEAGAAPGPGSVLRDRYVLEAFVGSGGASVVYRAVDRRRDATTAGGNQVAVKLLRPERRDEPRAIARLQREFRQTQAAAHPNVVRFHDLDCDRGSWFIVMELLSGETLASRLRRSAPGGLPAREALSIAAAVADALVHSHARQVVHGDVKPANIFLAGDGAVRLLDFGAAPAPGDAPEPPAATRAYASPEVLAGSHAVPGDDVFGLACVACELLSGAHPYGRRDAGAAVRQGAEPQRPAGLGDGPWQVLRRALDPERASRPRMGELAAALRGAVQAESAEVPAAVPVAAAATAPVTVVPAGRPRLVAGGAVVAGLILLLGILIGRSDRGGTPRPDAVATGPLGDAAAVPAPPPADPPAMAVTAPPQPATGPEVAPEPAPAAPPPATTGVVTFEQSSMVVSNRAVVAAIPLRHLSGAPRDTSVRWRIIEGSARPGRDYGGPESGVESFAAGNSFRILYVPIVANPASVRDRTFVVELTGAAPGVELGSAPRVAVTILGDG